MPTLGALVSRLMVLEDREAGRDRRQPLIEAIVAPGETAATITDRICGHRAAAARAAMVVGELRPSRCACWAWAASRSPGCSRTASRVSGNDWPVMWGFPILNYVWWIAHRLRRHVRLGAVLPDPLGLAHLDQPDRRNHDAVRRRLAPASTRSCIWGGLGSSIGCSRIPNTMELWPQWRSPLLWDFFALFTYVCAACMFWYLGLDPGSGRPCATGRSTRRRQVIYGVLALGFRGSGRQWRHFRATYGVMAAIMAPLVVLGPQHRRAGLRGRAVAGLAFDAVPAVLRVRRAAVRASPWCCCC